MLLYKFMPFESFVDVAVNRRMFLNQVLNWEDPYEADAMRELLREILKDVIDEVTPEIKAEVIRYAHRSIYGQSWTLLSESDALWRIYSPDKMGVCLVVDQHFIQPAECWTGDQGAVKKEKLSTIQREVTYCTVDEARHKVLSLRQKDQKWSIDPAECCFYKRIEFSHEREYRLCATRFPPGFTLDIEVDSNPQEVLAQFNGLTYPPLLYYDLDRDWIREIVLDPRAPDWFLSTLKGLAKLHLPNASVRRSELYGKKPA